MAWPDRWDKWFQRIPDPRYSANMYRPENVNRMINRFIYIILLEHVEERQWYVVG